MTQSDRARISLVRFGEDSSPAPLSDEHSLPWAIQSRLAPPPLVDVVARPRLLDGCLHPTSTQSLLLLAPPGYGKTALLAQLFATLQSRNCSVVWLSLSERDDTPGAFVAALSQAVMHGLSELRSVAAEATGDPERRLAAIVDALAAERRLHIVIDQVDALRDATVLDMLDRFSTSASPGTTIHLCGRRYSGPRFRKLISERRVRLLSAEDLRFNLHEIAQVVQCLPPGSAQRVSSLTGGFPLACRLMGEVARNRAGLDADRAFDLMRPMLAQWLDEQVLANVDDAQLGFLADSGAIGQFSLEILEQVPDRDYRWSDLEQAMQCGHYLGAVESQPGWYEYLGLFAEHLTARLRRSDPSRLALLHRYAADWFAKRAQPVDAIRHAAETGDPMYAAEITEKLGAVTLGFEKGAWILSYSRDVPQGLMQRFPLVALGQVYLSLEEGRFREARAAFERLKSSPSLGRLLIPEEPWTSEIGTVALLVEQVLRFYEDEPVTSRDTEVLARCLQTWQHGPPVLAGSVAAALSAILLNVHRFEEAASTADRGRLAVMDAGHCQASFVLRITGALSALALGHLREAALQVECAAQAAASLTDPQGKQAGYAELVRAQLQYEANELDAAWSVLKVIPARPEMLMNAWFDLQAATFDAAAALAAIRDGPEAVRAVIHEARRIARARGLRRLSTWSDVLQLRELIREGRYEEAVEMLESESLRGLLATSTGSPERYDLRVRSEALLAAVHLMVALGRYREAEDFLLRIDEEFVGSGDMRLRMEYGIAAMTSAFSLRRYAQACSQLVSVVLTGVETGMLRRLSDRREQLLQVGDWMQRVGRPMPAKVAGLLTKIRSDPAIRGSGRSGIHQITARPHESGIEGSLTEREVEVLALLADGLTSKEIASRLTITEGTVKTHRKKINRKLKVGSRSRVVAAARRMLLV